MCILLTTIDAFDDNARGGRSTFTRDEVGLINSKPIHWFGVIPSLCCVSYCVVAFSPHDPCSSPIYFCFRFCPSLIIRGSSHCYPSHFIRPSMHPFFLYPSIHSLTRSLVRSFDFGILSQFEHHRQFSLLPIAFHPSVHPSIHSLAHSLVHSFEKHAHDQSLTQIISIHVIYIFWPFLHTLFSFSSSIERCLSKKVYVW